MDGLLAIQSAFIITVLLGVVAFFRLTPRLKRQAFYIGVFVAIGDWILEYRGVIAGRWEYHDSMLMIGGVPIEIPLTLAFMAPIFLWLFQTTYNTQIDTITQFGAPELLVGVGFVVFLLSGDVTWTILFIGVAGLLIAERREMVVLIGLAAAAGDWVLEGIIFVDSGVIHYPGGWNFRIALFYMFLVWILGGWLTAQGRRMVK